MVIYKWYDFKKHAFNFFYVHFKMYEFLHIEVNFLYWPCLIKSLLYVLLTTSHIKFSKKLLYIPLKVLQVFSQSILKWEREVDHYLKKLIQFLRTLLEQSMQQNWMIHSLLFSRIETRAFYDLWQYIEKQSQLFHQHCKPATQYSTFFTKYDQDENIS